GGHAQLRQTRQMRAYAVETTESADMQFVQYGFRPGAPAPLISAPTIGVGVDHDTRIVDIAILHARCGVGHRHAGDAKAISRPGSAGVFQFEPARLAGAHGKYLRAITARFD